MERRDFLALLRLLCVQSAEAGILFSEDYEGKTPAELETVLSHHVQAAALPGIVVTMGEQGAVYATLDGGARLVPRKAGGCKGHHPARETPSSPVSPWG